MAIITQDQYNVVKQRYRRIIIKIDLLNFDFQVVGSIEGNLTTGGININANSDIRRTCNITIVIKNHTFKIDTGGQIWLDKYIKIYYGIIDNSLKEIIWTNMGIYLINNPNHIYDAVNNTISFAGIDLMAKISGARNGYFDWLYNFGMIEKGSNIREFFIDSLQLAGFTKYNIEDLLVWNEEAQQYLPEFPIDFEISSGNSLYDIFNNIRNEFFPNYEMFFDIDGVFNFKRIYNNASDPIIIDNDIFDKTILNISNDVDFENVKNAIQIWGQTLEPEYGNPVCKTYDNFYINGYKCQIESLKNEDEIPNNRYITVRITSVAQTNSPYLKINNFTPHPIINNESFFRFSTGYYILKYNSTYIFDSQIGVFERMAYQNEIKSATTFTTQTPKQIKGYAFNQQSINQSLFCVYITFNPSIEKPYLKINSGTPHPIVQDNDFFIFPSSGYYIMSYDNEMVFDSQTGVYKIIDFENASTIPQCSSNYSELYSDSAYSCIISSLLEFQQIPINSYIGIGIKDISLNQKPYLKINNYDSHPLVSKNNNTYNFYLFNKKINDIDYYIVVYDSEIEFDGQTGIFRVIGLQEVNYYIEDNNPESPFYVKSSIGKILLPLSGGEYDNIQTTEQAKERAEWELYNYARMNDRIRLTSVTIPWVDVNQKIQYINEDAEISGIFITKSISMDLSVEGTMTLECIRWYDYDPWDDK